MEKELMEKELKEKLEKMLCDMCYGITEQGGIFGDRYIIVDKFVSEKGVKAIVYFDLFQGKLHVEDIDFFTNLVADMDLQLTQNIINIDYANKKEGD